MAKLKLDLHEIYNKGQLIDSALLDVINDAVSKKIKLVEIIPGKRFRAIKKEGSSIFKSKRD